MFCMVLSSSVCAQLSVDTINLMRCFSFIVCGDVRVCVYFHAYGNVLIEKGDFTGSLKEGIHLSLPKYLDS